MNTFVYICRPGENEELRYSLRSIDKFYPESDVWVVGGKPSWYIGKFIEVPQCHDPYENARESLRMIVKHKEIPKDIVVMNDDFFFVRRLETIPMYVSGTIKDYININISNGNNSRHISELRRSNEHCKSYVSCPLNFDIHVPIPVNKEKLSTILKEGIMWRSNYGNKFADIEQVHKINDVKVYTNKRYSFKTYDYKSLEHPFISRDDTSFEEVLNDLLAKMFETPSKYESKT